MAFQLAASWCQPPPAERDRLAVVGELINTPEQVDPTPPNAGDSLARRRVTALIRRTAGPPTAPPPAPAGCIG